MIVKILANPSYLVGIFSVRDHTNSQTIFKIDANAGSSALHLQSSGATFAGSITVGDGHFIGDDGDDNLLIQGSAGENVIIDSADDIILDADGADIRFKDGGTEFGKLSKGGGSDLVITSSIDDKDIIFTGLDGGSAITALTLDMSNGGAATFSGGITVVGSDAQFNHNIILEGSVFHKDDTNTSFGFPADDAIAFTTSGTEAIRIDASQNVGIGTASPAHKLDVQVSGNVARFGDGTRFFRIYTDSDEVSLLADGSVPMKFYTSGSERMRIDSAGNVGIGTGATVDANLHVVGTDIKLQGIGIAGDLTFAYNAGNNSTTVADVNYANINATVTSGSTGSESGKLSFQTRNAGTVADRMVIDSAGNVGIGTTAPDKRTSK